MYSIDIILIIIGMLFTIVATFTQATYVMNTKDFRNISVVLVTLYIIATLSRFPTLYHTRSYIYMIIQVFMIVLLSYLLYVKYDTYNAYIKTLEKEKKNINYDGTTLE